MGKIREEILVINFKSWRDDWVVKDFLDFKRLS